ncbi:SseB family protein, partial [Actinomadura roseirufa]|uniref:SseB family protein n=1 Tax=Actinomadura roseirufa TaxID=2094049 RepID=UPI001A954CE5
CALPISVPGPAVPGAPVTGPPPVGTPPPSVPPSVPPTAPPTGPPSVPPSGPPSMPAGGPPATQADLLEPRLAEAKERGDHTTYFSLLESADLVLPATGPAVEDPDRAELPTITIGSGIYVTVFTSPGTLARAGDQHPGLYRRTSFASLAAGWPDPEWQLAINPGLPSEVHLDASAIARLGGSQRATPAPEPDVSNPYGAVDPNALSGPNPVAGGSLPSANGSRAASNGAPYSDDAHTAIDSYTVADLQAALESGGVTPGRGVPIPPEPVQPQPAEHAPPQEQPLPPSQAEPPGAAQPPSQAHPPSQARPPAHGRPAQEPPAEQPGPPAQAPPVQVPPPAQASPSPQPLPAAEPLPIAEPPEQAPPAQPPSSERTRPPRAPEHAGPSGGTAPPEQDPSPAQAHPLVPVREPEVAAAPLGAPTGDTTAREHTGAIPLQPPHGTRLYQSTGDGEETPLAVYDAVSGVWTPIGTDTGPASRGE